jgi:hypothetical protein
MDTKTPVFISVFSAILLLVLAGFLTMFIQILLLNGVMNEGQATTALIVTLGCQGLTVILGAIFARWLTRLLMLRFEWSRTAAILTPIVIVLVIAAGSGFLSIMGGLLAAGVK